MTSYTDIFNMKNVEQAPPDTKYYRHLGNVVRISIMQEELEKCGVDTTILCLVTSDDCYYTPKNATAGPVGGSKRWVSK